MKLINKKIERVALINPNYITKSITDKFTLPALGLEYIAANILDLVEVKIINGKVRNLSVTQIMKELIDFEPDVVGISCCYTIGINFALKIAKESKMQGYSTVLGGWHPNFEHSEILKYPFVDLIVRGEGELTFREVIENKELETIKGISYRSNGTIFNNPDRPLIKDLDKLPFPARSLRHKKSYFQAFQMPIDVVETSRGCPYRCIFCNIHLFYRGTYRTKSPERVIKELKIISNKNPRKNVFIVDDNFTANIKRVEQICDLIVEEGIKLDLICQSRIDVIKKNPEIIKKMAKAGFWLFFLGIESFNQKALNNIQKKTQFRDILEAIEILHDNDILLIGSLLVGSKLDETEEEINQMIKIVKKLRIDFPLYSIMTPLPGTQFRKYLIENNYEISKNWSEYNFTTAVNPLHNLSKDKLEQLLSKAYYYGYFNRGWRETMLRIYKRKGIKLFLNLRNFLALKDILYFFRDIRRMRSHKNSSSIEPIRFN
ncbi:MAG: B12-binding domain-containing radical SAM protein [Candidatus Thorarchaeota archaeon]